MLHSMPTNYKNMLLMQEDWPPDVKLPRHLMLSLQTQWAYGSKLPKEEHFCGKGIGSNNHAGHQAQHSQET